MVLMKIVVFLAFADVRSPYQQGRWSFPKVLKTNIWTK